MLEPLDQFRAALAQRGIVPKGGEIIADGRIHRCDADGRGGKGDAAYLLHLDGIPAGGFENWRDGFGWENWRADIDRMLSPAEEAVQRAKLENSRRERELEEAKRKASARKRALSVFEEAALCDSHPYTDRKGIQTHGARLRGDRLVLPLRDTEGTIHSLQFIGPDGEKRYLTGGRKAGCYFDIGQPDGVVCVAEGFATGASIYEATGYAVAVAFDAGNLLAVTKGLRKKHPELRLIVCADDDHRSAGNPGIAKATEAALSTGALLAVPVFGTDRKEVDTDFNDLHQCVGLDAVRRCIEDARKPSEPDDDSPQADEGEEPTGDAPSHDDAATSTSVAEIGQECRFAAGRFRLTQRGVFYIARDGNTGLEKTPQWICSGLAVVAATRDAKSNAWGRLLEWCDADTPGTPGGMPQVGQRPDQPTPPPCPRLSPRRPWRLGTRKPAWMLVSPLSPLVPALSRQIAPAWRSRASFACRPLVREDVHPRRADTGQAGFLCRPAVAAGHNPAVRPEALGRRLQVEAGAHFTPECFGQHQILPRVVQAPAIEPGPVDDALIDVGGHVLETACTMCLEEAAYLLQQSPVFTVARAAEGIQPCCEALVCRLGGFAFGPARQAVVGGKFTGHRH